MLDIQIDQATREDCEIIADFNIQLALETESKHLDRDLVLTGVLESLGDVRGCQYFVARYQNHVVGQIMFTREWSDWRNGEFWWFQSVYVSPDYRRQGIFQQLSQHVQSLAESNPDVVGLRLYVEAENERAQSTYRQLGFKFPGYQVMEKMLDR
ncbi:GNAT family N-acetyltransferase [Gimesia maris]|jgi:ribosomal protein S18 acetylase RimI-like enzyme|uniref:GNAT family N-acetyltransferase n=1 Tax=Gimesia maris TaxID=122 RepID=A0A3D3R4Q9_9PLAN|nr:GNAT family N-acetyltransferase [Gimesia sp.]HCO23795.1 GNAT family N-acetyltransferase [Gimesia maris]|tara:strand:- start:61896 stop:62357 length:462 start_codon:yes stop_codon:yes gene_type:complete